MEGVILVDCWLFWVSLDSGTIVSFIFWVFDRIACANFLLCYSFQFDESYLTIVIFNLKVTVDIRTDSCNICHPRCIQTQNETILQAFVRCSMAGRHSLIVMDHSVLIFDAKD